jgi:hypothetical protein
MLWAFPNLHWVLILVNPVTWGALLTGLSNTGTIFTSVLACLARKAFGFSPRLAWAGLIPQLWTFGTCWNKLCRLFCFLRRGLYQNCSTSCGPLHSIRIYWPGLSNIGKIYPLVFGCLISRLLDSHPHIYLGLMGLSRSCRLLGLVDKNACVFCFLCWALPQ